MAKPRTASGYDSKYVEHVRGTCLYVATKLGDLLDELVVVGGIVPTLIIDQTRHDEKHVGTMDLDVGMAIGVLDSGRYQEITDRLRQAGFGPDQNEKGMPTRQRWRIVGPPKVTVDFLIPPTRSGDKGGQLRDLEKDFAAIIAPGLSLAFVDRQRVTLRGKTIKNEEAARDVWVCGPGAFVAMKALAFRNRGENKDAYDIVYMLRHYGTGLSDVVTALKPLLDRQETKEALDYLRADFASVDAIGPIRATEFLFDDRNDDARADAWGAVRDLLDGL
jgi:hypothetical protein